MSSSTTEVLDALLAQIRACAVCALPYGPCPIVQAGVGAPMPIIGRPPRGAQAGRFGAERRVKFLRKGVAAAIKRNEVDFARRRRVSSRSVRRICPYQDGLCPVVGSRGAP